jgi:hypothetical protein
MMMPAAGLSGAWRLGLRVDDGGLPERLAQVETGQHQHELLMEHEVPEQEILRKLLPTGCALVQYHGRHLSGLPIRPGPGRLNDSDGRAESGSLGCQPGRRDSAGQAAGRLRRRRRAPGALAGVRSDSENQCGVERRLDTRPGPGEDSKFPCGRPCRQIGSLTGQGGQVQCFVEMEHLIILF